MNTRKYSDDPEYIVSNDLDEGDGEVGFIGSFDKYNKSNIKWLAVITLIIAVTFNL
jgi:hypothetical protein